MTPAAGAASTVIQHNDGDREVYVHRRARDEEPAVVLELHDDEARQLGAILGGAYERPKIVEELEMALGEFQIEWIKVPSGSWVERPDARGLRLPEAHRRDRDRDPPGVRVDRRRTARGRDPRRGHDRRASARPASSPSCAAPRDRAARRGAGWPDAPVTARQQHQDRQHLEAPDPHQERHHELRPSLNGA